MSPYILILTHIGAAGLGAALCYVIVKRYAKVVEVEGHPAIEITPKEERVSQYRGVRWPGLLLLTFGVVLLIIGIQTYLGKSAEKESDRRDAVYATCIKNYAQDAANGIVDTIQIRNKANLKVERAEVARDNAVDRVLGVVADARKTPPTANEADFDEALIAATEAKRELRKARREAKGVKDRNEYKDAVPEPECKR